MKQLYRPYQGSLLKVETFYIDSIIYKSGDLSILFRSFSKEVEIRDKVRVVFGNMLSYRVIDEGDFLKTLKDNPEIQDEHIIYDVENSNYINWFHEQSLGIRSGSGLRHYAVYSESECVDVLAYGAPIISVG